MSLTKARVEHIAFLARLRLREDEFGDVVDKLSRIVEFVDRLQAAATDDVQPMAHPLDLSQRLRPDVVGGEIDRASIQRNAPAVRDGFYLVPLVMDQGDGPG